MASKPWERDYSASQGPAQGKPWERSYGEGSSVIIDDETGAPYTDRFIIGSASSDADKLARAQGLYGQSAMADADGRISYEPEPGQRRYVNPSGFDMGDIAGSAREVASAAATLPFDMSMVGIPAGAAAGAATGQGVDALAAYMARSRAEENGNQVPQVQGLMSAAKEAGYETAGGIVGGAAGKAVGAGLGKMINPTNPRLVQGWRDLDCNLLLLGLYQTAKQLRGWNQPLVIPSQGAAPSSEGLWQDARGLILHLQALPKGLVAVECRQPQTNLVNSLSNSLRRTRTHGRLLLNRKPTLCFNASVTRLHP